MHNLLTILITALRKYSVSSNLAANQNKKEETVMFLITVMQETTDGGFIALKGFCYQFDKTIAEVFEQAKSEVQIEQVHDLGYDDYIIQVKHHDTKYTAAQIRAKKKKPIIQLLEQYIVDSGKHYVLYIYFKDIAPGQQKLNLDELNAILASDASNFTDILKTDFLNKFILVYAPDFVSQHGDVIYKIKKKFSVSEDEAELYYALISSHLLQIVISHPPNQKDQRKTSLVQLVNFINKGRKVIAHSGYATFLTKEKYHRLLRKKFFNTSLNMSPYERFFLIEIDVHTPITNLVDTVLAIRNKWHKNGKRVPKPFAPYICFRNITALQLKMLKKQLREEDCVIKDGYDYQDADFEVNSLVEKVTHENKITFRIINNTAELAAAMIAVTRTKELYQFYHSAPHNIDVEFKHIKIQVEELADVNTII